MASIIKIKRSTGSTAPSQLGSGEIAYSWDEAGSYAGGKFWIGTGSETEGVAANIHTIGGKYFTDMLDHTPGTLTASSAIVTDSSSKIDNLKVDNIDLNGNTVSTTDTNGNLVFNPNGTGLISIANAYTLPRSDGTAGQALTTNGSGVVSFTTVSTTLNVAGDTGTDGVSLLNDTLTFVGGTGITSAVTNNTVTFDIDNTVAVRADTTYVGTTAVTLNRASANQDLTGITSITLPGSTSGSAQIIPTATAGSGTTITLPASSGTVALTNNKLSVFAATSSSELAGVISDETGSGALVFANTPTLVTPYIGEATATSLTGAAALTITAGGSNTNVTLVPQGTGTVDVSSKRITSLADPTQAQDAATKSYVDAVKTGLDTKDSVRVATTGTITLSGIQTIDGVELSAGDRVLVKNQSNAIYNGIYTVASGAWSRASDFDNTPGSEITAGAYAFVEEGDTNPDSGWVLTTNGTITLGSTELNFAQFSGAGQVIAGDALLKTGNTLDVRVAASGGIEIVSDALQLKSSLAGDGLTYASGVLDVVGTADRITVSANAVDIASTYAGQNTIVTVGTITSGTWNGSIIGAGYGGTGLSSITSRAIMYGNGSSTVGVTAASSVDGSFLREDSTGNPYWSNTVDGGTY